MNNDVCSLSATELVRLYRTRQLSPVEATEAVLDRIGKLDGTCHAGVAFDANETLDGGINAFRLIDAESARSQARESEKRWMRGAPNGLIDGVPTTIKDLIVARG